MKELTENQKNAFVWWKNLSINEMKELTKKYFPSFSHIDLYKMGPIWIEEIYNKENDTTK